MVRIGALVTSLLLLFSCSQNSFDHISSIVVNGVFSDLRDPVVFVSSTASAFEPSKLSDLLLDDAYVTLLDQTEQVTYEFQLVGNGKYSIRNFNWEVDHNYQVLVEHQNNLQVSSEVLKFPQNPQIIDYAIEEGNDGSTRIGFVLLNNMDYVFFDGVYNDSISDYKFFGDFSILLDDFLLVECDPSEEVSSITTKCFIEDEIEITVGTYDAEEENAFMYVSSIDSNYHVYNKQLYEAEGLDFIFYKAPLSISNINGGYGLVVMRRDVKIDL